MKVGSINHIFANKSFASYDLALPVPIPDEEKKLSEILFFTLLCGASKGFIKASTQRPS